MNVLERIRHWVTMPRPGSARTRQYSHTLFLKFLSSQQVGGFVLGHYLANPEERPDHMVRHDFRCHPRTWEDFVTIRRAVVPLSAEDDARLERSVGGPPENHLLALTDEGGNIFMLDHLTEAGAQRVMGLAGTELTVRSDKQDE